MSRIAYVNGAYLPQPVAGVNVEDRGYLFGDGIYEVTHVHDGRFVDEDRHLARLERSLAEIRLTMPLPLRSLKLVLREVVRRNRVRHGLVYMQVTRGVARRDHAFPAPGTRPGIVVMAKRMKGFPERIEGWGGGAVLCPDLRWARRDIKSVNLLPNVLAKQAAREQGAVEAILFDERSGEVTEGSSTSVWMVDEHGAIRVPPFSHALLPGITRQALAAEMSAAGIALEERSFTVDELRRAREVFLTSATSFVKPILSIDGVAVGDGAPGPVSRRLFDLFARHVAGGPRNAA